MLQNVTDSVGLTQSSVCLTAEERRDFKQIVIPLRRLNPVFRVHACHTALLGRIFLRFFGDRGRLGRFRPDFGLRRCRRRFGATFAACSGNALEQVPPSAPRIVFLAAIQQIGFLERIRCGIGFLQSLLHLRIKLLRTDLLHLN